MSILNSNNVVIGFGDSSNRPSPAATSMIRYNTATGQVEVYTGSTWVNIGGTTYFNSLSLDSNNNLIQTYYSTTDSNATLDPTNALSTFFGNATLSIDSNGNLTATY